MLGYATLIEGTTNKQLKCTVSGMMNQKTSHIISYA